jgi:hypothetical protein
MGDEADKQIADFQTLRQVVEEARKEANMSLYEARELRALVTRVEKDIDLWDVRAYRLRRLCYWAIGVPPAAVLIDIGGHLLGWLH